MPFVNIKITRDGVTPEKKAEVIRGVAKVLADVRGRGSRIRLEIICAHEDRDK
jgi:4-oxalocrotonate tautomerase